MKQRFEYHSIYLNGSTDHRDEINKAAKKGWRLIAVAPDGTDGSYYYWFERPVKK